MRARSQRASGAPVWTPTSAGVPKVAKIFSSATSFRKSVYHWPGVVLLLVAGQSLGFEEVDQGEKLLAGGLVEGGGVIGRGIEQQGHGFRYSEVRRR